MNMLDRLIFLKISSKNLFLFNLFKNNLNSIINFISNRDVKQVFELFFTDEIIDLIVKHTNEKIEENYGGLNYSTDTNEVRCFIGILILMGALGDSKQPLKYLYSNSIGRGIYKAAMSRNRFEILTSCLRFDDRRLRSCNNAFYPMEELTDILIRNFGNYWSPSEVVVIDEMMVPFNGRCSFKSYQPAKPVKRGIQLRSCCDAYNRYILKFKVYSGESQSIFQQMSNLLNVSNIIGSGRTLVTDNFYSSIDNAERFFVDFKLHSVATLRINRPHIPEKLKIANGRPTKSSIFIFTPPYSNLVPITLQSFIPRKGKVLNFLSTRHYSNAVDTNGLSDINSFYNKSKFGIDTIDQMISNASCKRKTNKWPLALFYDYIDMSVVNTLTISFDLKLLKESNKRRDNMLYLGLELIINSVKGRQLIGLNSRIRSDIKETIDLFNKYKNQYSNESSINGSSMNESSINDSSMNESCINESSINENCSNRKSYCFICLERPQKEN